MGRAADDIHGSVAQGSIGSIDRKDELNRRVEPFPFEKPEFHGGRRWKIRIRD
jgi:hypothetical protein